MKYKTKLREVTACQYHGPGEQFELEGVKLTTNEAAGGYARKLAYISDPRRGPRTVRPGDFVVLDDGETRIMNPVEFEKEFEVLKNNIKRGKTVKKDEDNAQELGALTLE